MRKIWGLISYPKSGNTWIRIFLNNYLNRDPTDAIDINALKYTLHIASTRFLDELFGFDSSELPEVTRLAYQKMALAHVISQEGPDLFLKSHAAYRNDSLESFYCNEILSGVIYVVRYPLDVCISFANHQQKSIHEIIRIMGDESFHLYEKDNRIDINFPEWMGSWSGHINSWLDCGHKLHLVRYEELIANPLSAFKAVIEFLGWEYDARRLEESIRVSSFQNVKQQEIEAGFKEKNPKAHSFFFSGKVGLGIKVLSDTQRKKLLEDQGGAMERLGYQV